ncbi:MAG: SEC-C metal-binding domain-containing protein, partial [Candidatus Limnocylindrales bacterium]
QPAATAPAGGAGAQGGNGRATREGALRPSGPAAVGAGVAGAGATTSLSRPMRLEHGDGDGSPADPSGGRAAASQPKLGRNEPCWCGSGLKYKKCHGR